MASPAEPEPEPSSDDAEVGSHAGTLDLTGGSSVNNDPENGSITGSINGHPEIMDRTGGVTAVMGDRTDSSRRYGGPMVRQYTFPITACLLMAVLLVTTVVLSATSLNRSNEALAKSKSVEKDMMAALKDKDDALAVATLMEKDMMAALNEKAKEEAAAAAANSAVTVTVVAVTSSPTTEPTTRLPTSQPTTKPTTSLTTSTPITATEPTHPLKKNPQWFQTTHDDFQMMQGGENHDWHTATMLCNKNFLRLCAYEAYCPEGPGFAPYGGGGTPGIHNASSFSFDETTQWAPYYDPNPQKDPSIRDWVQIGVLEGGTEENEDVKCVKYDDWYGGNGVDVADVWGSEQRMWILCCEQEEYVEEEEPEEEDGAGEELVDGSVEIILDNEGNNPQWFQTTHADFVSFSQQIEENNSTEYSHDWHISNALCSRNNLILCGYESYCPEGQGFEPFNGGPPQIHNWATMADTQWAPYYDPTPQKNPSKTDWVQIGEMEGGGTNEENVDVKCWKYDDWYAGNGVDIVDVWGDEERMWILCCEQEEYVEEEGEEFDKEDDGAGEEEEVVVEEPILDDNEGVVAPPLNDPQWFQTTHADFQKFSELNEEQGGVNHDWEMANMLCSQNGLILCEYGSYCPDGPGYEPFGGGPPQVYNSASLDETQWAPYYDPKPMKDPRIRNWIQIGVMDGGPDGNEFVKCVKYEDWYGGNGVDIADVWEDEQRMWILCCEMEEYVEEEEEDGAVEEVAGNEVILDDGVAVNKPKWFQTTHADFQMFSNIKDEIHEDHNHDWYISNMVCSQNGGLKLCEYNVYCPDGQGSEAFGGGPPQIHNWASMDETQWAPYTDSNATQETRENMWVQVGVLEGGDEGGTDENGFAKCWKYNDWYADGNDGVDDIVNVWGGEQRMWILCCAQDTA